MKTTSSGWREIALLEQNFELIDESTQLRSGTS